MTTLEMLDALELGIRALTAEKAELRSELSGRTSVEQGTVPATVVRCEDAPCSAVTARDLPPPDVHWSFPVRAVPTRASGSASPESPRQEMQSTGLADEEVAVRFNVPVQQLRNWLDGRCCAPAWLIPGIHFLQMVEGGSRRNGHRPGESRSKHPFSRIEEL